MRRWYRVEHRGGGRVRAFGLVVGVAPEVATLAAFAGRLVRDGAAGELVLVEEATGREVARLALPGPRAADPGDPLNDPGAVGSSPAR